MAQFPTQVATFREKQNLPGVTFVDPDKATIYADDLIKIEGEIGAIETTLGTQPQGAAATVDERIYNVEVEVDLKQPALGFVPENVSNKDTSTSLGSSDTKYPSQKAVKTYIDSAITAVKAALFPVGSIYSNADNSTNPATLLGFGTWSAFGAGRVLVGKNTSGTFATAGATGGAETHTLTIAQMPSHDHATTKVNPAYGASVYASGYNGNVLTANGTGEGTGYTASSGEGAAHNNLQPYVVVYMWRRTA